MWSLLMRHYSALEFYIRKWQWIGDRCTWKQPVVYEMFSVINDSIVFVLSAHVPTLPLTFPPFVPPSPLLLRPSLPPSLPQMSEEPVYRISTLEGQVRLCQEKLTESHRQHDDILAKERARAEENLAHLRSELTSELQLAQETIEQLRAKGVATSSEPSKQGAKEEEARPPKGSVAISVSDASMNSPTSEKRRRRKPQKEDLAERSLSPQPIPRSASWADVHAGEGAGPGGLPDAVPGKSSNVGGEKLSITDLVAESLKNPGCIATIRRELKADALTPKIQRKFHMKTTPTSLPSMNDSSSSLEASPLTKENMKVVTPRTRNVLPNTNI